MTGPQILLSVVLGLLINECCDVSPWLARRLVRWAAHHRYVKRERAEVRAEELSALINDLPGKVVKLVTAVSFGAVAAAICVGRGLWRRTPSRIKRLARQVARRRPTVASSFLDARVVVMDTSERGVEAIETVRGNGFVNDLECDWVAGACWSLDNELRLHGESATVSVLTYYRAQAVAIRHLLGRISPYLRSVRLQIVGTVDEAHGQESDYIIVSFTRSSRSGPNPRFGGFLQDVRRLNVALTRARRTLVLVGHAPTLRRLGDPDSDIADLLTRVIDSEDVPIIRNRHWILPGDAEQVLAYTPDWGSGTPRADPGFSSAPGNPSTHGTHDPLEPIDSPRRSPVSATKYEWIFPGLGPAVRAQGSGWQKGVAVWRGFWRFRGWLIGVTLILGAGGLLWFARWFLTLPEGDLSRADQRSSVMNAVTGVIGLGLTALSVALSLRPFRQGDPRTVLDSAAARLAQRLRIGYEREASYRQLQLLGPLKIMWEPVSEGVISQASQRIEGTGRDLDALAAALARLSPEQLVITGDPASGKSSMALQLALALLKNQDEGMRRRVPVFLSVSSWRPREQPLSDWLISQLAEEHPELTHPEYGKQAPRDLVEQDRVLPILDDFDELSPDLHDTARGRMVEAAASGRPFILTMRTEAYLKAVRAQGKAFGQAAVVRLRPLTTAQAIAVLTADDVGEVRQRWEPVERRMKNAHSPLARVLSSPLMVYLARLAYSPRDMDPAQLTRFKRDKEIIDHLFDSYLPALYRSRYDPLRVRRWLGLLAHHLKTSERSTDLAWWRLLPLVPRARAAFVLSIGAVVTYLFFLQYGAFGFIVGFVAIPLCQQVTDGRRPRQLRLRQIGPKRFVVATALGVVTGCAFIPIIEPGYDWRFAALAVATLGITVTLLASLAFSLRLPDVANTTQPRAMLANDRTALLGVVTLVGVAAGIRSGVQYSPARGLLDALQSMLLIGLLVSAGMRLGSGWLTFGIARLSLSLRRRFPLRLLGFLEDAHRRGVLRRSGPLYQFRHADLQRYLTADRAGPTRNP